MSKLTPYPPRIARRMKAARRKSASVKKPMGRLGRVLKKGARGDGSPLTIAVTLVLLLLFCVIGEYFRVSIIAQGVRDAVQQAVIATVNDNYDDVYHSVREGYAAGWVPADGEAWEESLDTGNVYANLAATLGLSSGGHDTYVKYAGGEVEYSLSGLAVVLNNNGLASGESEGYTATASIQLEIPTSFAGDALPPIRLELRVQAKYVPLF